MVDVAEELLNYSLDAEQNVIGGLLLEPERLHDIALRPEHFHHASHQLLFAAITRMVSAGHPVDPVTVSEELAAHDQLGRAGGMGYVGSLAQNCLSAANIRRYAQIVFERAQERAMLAAAVTISELAQERHGRELHERQAEAARVLESVLDDAAGHDSVGVDAHEAVRLSVQRMQARLDKPEGLGGLSFGLRQLDDMTDGMKAGKLIVIAGRPSMGKSALLLQACRAAGVCVDMQSYEMDHGEIMDRGLCQVGSVDHSRFSKAQLNHDELQQLTHAVSVCSRLPFSIHTRDAGLHAICARARRAKRRNQLGLLAIDHLHLMPLPPAPTEASAYGEITRTLKKLAMELEIPVVLLCQLNRESTKGGRVRRPSMADLRASGSIEQDADLIVLVHRPGHYDENENPYLAELIVDKHRGGPTGIVRVGWNGAYTRFEDSIRAPDVMAPKRKVSQHFQDDDL